MGWLRYTHAKWIRQTNGKQNASGYLKQFTQLKTVCKPTMSLNHFFWDAHLHSHKSIQCQLCDTLAFNLQFPSNTGDKCAKRQHGRIPQQMVFLTFSVQAVTIKMVTPCSLIYQSWSIGSFAYLGHVILRTGTSTHGGSFGNTDSPPHYQRS